MLQIYFTLKIIFVTGAQSKVYCTSSLNQKNTTSLNIGTI